MDYSTIVKQLVYLYPDRIHSFVLAWPEGEEFPTDLGDEFLCDMKTVMHKDAKDYMGDMIIYGDNLFSPMTKYEVFLTIYDGLLDNPFDNSGLPYASMKSIWKDFTIENPVVPQIINRAMTIIHGANWQARIPTTVTYEVTTKVKKPFVNMTKL